MNCNIAHTKVFKDFADFMNKPNINWSWRSMKDDPPHLGIDIYYYNINERVVRIMTRTNVFISNTDDIMWSPVFIPEPYKEEKEEPNMKDIHNNCNELYDRMLKIEALLENVRGDDYNPFIDMIEEQLEACKEVLEAME